jgi:hypothetical protein
MSPLLHEHADDRADGISQRAKGFIFMRQDSCPSRAWFWRGTSPRKFSIDGRRNYPTNIFLNRLTAFEIDEHSLSQAVAGAYC